MLQITANKYFTVDDAKKLINKKSDWILGHLSKATKNLLENEYYYFTTNIICFKKVLLVRNFIRLIYRIFDFKPI